MPTDRFLLALLLMTLAMPAQAVVKLYDSSVNNGTPGTDAGSNPENPDVQTPEGYIRLTDDSTGTVTLEELVIIQDQFGNVGPDILTELLGPGAFFFATQLRTGSISASHVSNGSGVGAHGPSSTAPGSSAEWGIVTGFEVTGLSFCLSSPPVICNQNVSPHGATGPTPVYSNTYDLGTWDFDAEGDMNARNYYIFVTANGGLTNTQRTLRGSFHGASLPALPLIGFGALAASLGVLGARKLRRSR